MKELTDKQKAARKLVTEYTRYLCDQEALVGRMVERKWAEVSPLLEQIIDRKVHEYFDKHDISIYNKP